MEKMPETEAVSREMTTNDDFPALFSGRKDAESMP